MKLFGSLLTTGLIIGFVWGVALLQVPSAQANTAEEKASSSADPIPSLPQKIAKRDINSRSKEGSRELSAAKANSQKTSFSDLAITGVNKRISLDNIALLWQTFDAKTLLHARLIKQPSKVYVYYQNFSKDYQSADVSIGYFADIVKPSTQATAQINGDYQQLLSKGAYTTDELTTAWQKIDYRKRVHSVVEVHYLDKNNQSISAEVLVNYL